MPHATKAKKQTRPRVSAAVSAPVSYPARSQQSNQASSSSTSAASSGASSYSYSWTAADAAKASRDGAFLTAWPPDESYYAPPVHFLGPNYQAYQEHGQAQSQEQTQSGQYYYSSTHKPPTASNQGGSGN
ncbi:hypothetical protein F4781DRAFT_437672 [Annulohypoxylon bovei var. microspora]|nr:hypothetical protein F4781DRAFT_437672 [Annulohypoxylon bovei var. microspora]